jgi:hypothetical protein
MSQPVRGHGPHIVKSKESVLYRKHKDEKSLSSRLTASGAYLFQSEINGSSSFYSPDKVTSLLLDDLKSRCAELNAMVAGFSLERRTNLLHTEPIEEIHSLLVKEGFRYSRKKIALGLYGQGGYGDKEAAGLIVGYEYVLNGLRLPINKPEDLLTGRALVHNGLPTRFLNPLANRSSLDEAFLVLKKDKLDPFAKIALIHFFYLHSGLFAGSYERFLYLLLTVLVADSYSAPFAFTLARHLSANEKKIRLAYEAMLKESSKADLDRFVYRYCRLLSSFLDEEILKIRQGR